MFEPDIIGLGVANVDVVLRLEDMPRWENPGVVSGFALADGGPARPVWWPRRLTRGQDLSTQLATMK